MSETIDDIPDVNQENNEDTSTLKNTAEDLIKEDETVIEKPQLVHERQVEPEKPIIKMRRKSFAVFPEQCEVWEFTSTTLNLFQIEYPVPRDGEVEANDKLIYHFIPLPNIIADVSARGILSDFSKKMKKILDSKMDEILISYQSSGQGKYYYDVYLHPEAVDAFCNEYGLIPHVSKSLKNDKNKGWLSLGTEKEIDEEKVLQTLPLNSLMLSKTRRKFSQPYQFHDKDAEDSYVEGKMAKIEGNETFWIQRNIGIQSAAGYKNSDCQTTWNRKVNFSCQYDPAAKENVAEDLENPQLITFLDSSLNIFNQSLTKNLLSNITRNEFLKLGEDDTGIEQGSQILLQEYHSFTDLKHSKDRSISCVDWHPNQRGVVGVSCIQRCTLDEKLDLGYHAKSKQSVLLLWNFSDPINPQLILEGPDEITAFKFNPSNSNIIVGGCSNGQIVVWDISEFKDKLSKKKKGGETINQPRNDKNELSVVRHVATSAIEFSHRGSVTDISWVPKTIEVLNTGDLIDSTENQDFNQFVSGSLDGQVFFWDLRFRKEVKMLDLCWRPFIKVPLTAMDNTFDYGCTKVCIAFRSPSLLNLKGSAPGNLDFNVSDKSILSKFYCGTEEGDLILVDWTEKKAEEKASRVEFSWNSHYGTISDIQRSPFFQDIILSVGNRYWHIWKEGLFTSPILSSHLYNSDLVATQWSPTRPNVFFVARADGYLEAWDIVDRSNEPSLLQSIATSGLTTMTLHVYSSTTGSQLLACGDDTGTLHILQIPKMLCRTGRNEKAMFKLFLEREIKRVYYVEEEKVLMNAEKQNQQAQAAIGVEKKEKNDDSIDLDDENMEKTYSALEKEFMERISATA